MYLDALNYNKCFFNLIIQKNKKVFPKVISDGIVGTVSCPIKYYLLI